MDRAEVGARPEVLVVGSGPVGLVAAGLLGAAGVATLVVERNGTTSNEAKAISIDDESLRVLQRAGLAGDVYPILRPGTGTRYFGAGGRPLVHARGRQPYRLGHPFKSPFAQPDLERALVCGVTRSPNVKVRFDTELTSLAQSGDDVACTLRLADGTQTTVRSSFVLGCDGGRSTVRRTEGIAMQGRSLEDTWLVVDTVNDGHRERYGMHHGDPRRPHVIIPGRGGRCRYEFKLTGAECHGEARALALRLVSQHREIDDDDIERCTIYRFHALVAERWRSGRVFLAGDAAHMMPPFAGQGLNSGIRDADNLCWKLASVLRGAATPALLDTYETERRPHAQAMVELSVRLGRIVMTSDPKAARARDFAVRAATKVPTTRRWLSEMRYKPQAVYRSGFVDAGSLRRAGKLVGRMFPQPLVLDAGGRLVLLDEMLGPGFSLVGVACSPEQWLTAERSGLAALACRHVDVALDDIMGLDAPGRVGVADADGQLQRLLSPYRGSMLLLRPDRYVAAVAPPDLLSQAAAGLGRFITPETARAATPTMETI